MANDYYWRTENPLVFKIGGKKFNLDVQGIAYAEQFGRLTGWLGSYGVTGFFAAYDSGVLDETKSDVETLSTIISYLVQYGISPQAMIELGAILLNTDQAFVEKHFDPGWFVDALIALIDNKPGIRAAFMRLWERFFLAAGEDTGDQEDQAQD